MKSNVCATRAALKPNTPWSRIDDYTEYFSLQTWIRGEFPSEEPLRVESRLWRKEMEELDKESG